MDFLGINNVKEVEISSGAAFLEIPVELVNGTPSELSSHTKLKK